MITILSIFGDVERLISEDLYPYRYVITPLLFLSVAALLIVAVSKRAHLIVLRHRLVSLLIGVPLLMVCLLAGNYLLSPLWERSFLEEASPLQAAVDESKTTGGGPILSETSSDALAPQVPLRGDFKGADDFHFGRGTALLISGADGINVLRLEDFSVRNGPDLYVYLSRETDGKRVDETLNLGRLKATDGAFNYELPASVDPSSIKSVLVWCRQFSVLFAIAEIER
jgi:hypothetical protein